jgi:hypothetical protein
VSRSVRLASKISKDPELIGEEARIVQDAEMDVVPLRGDLRHGLAQETAARIINSEVLQPQVE